MIYGGYNQAPSYSVMPANTPRFTRTQPTYVAPVPNPYEAELRRKEAELRKLREDKKHSDFYVIGMATISVISGIVGLLSSNYIKKVSL